jgi:2Fe-2S ferredoxin
MVKLTFVAADGGETVIEANVGQSVMLAATRNNVPGIVGECGGNAACGTCRVYVDPAWREATGERLAAEAEMLEFTGDEDPTARLSCQIRVTEELDGLVLRTPESQY